MDSIVVRTARAEDGRVLQRIDAAAWTRDATPADAPAADTAFFGPRTAPDDVLVADAGGTVVGYVKVAAKYPDLASARHVLEVQGLAVDPERQGAGVGRRLVEAAIERAAERGARRLTLRVLARNTAARRLYERCGFRVEGVLRGEFHLGGRDVDDILLALAPADRQVGSAALAVT